MYSISAPELLVLLSDFPHSRELHLRSIEKELKGVHSRHEIEVLALAGYVEGYCNKYGLRYVQLTVAHKVAMKRLHRMVVREGSTVAEDCKTVNREILGGGIVFTHRRTYAWTHRARSCDSKAIQVIPRFTLRGESHGNYR